MNPSFEAFVDPSDGFHDKHGTPSNREGQYAPWGTRITTGPFTITYCTQPECLINISLGNITHFNTRCTSYYRRRYQ